MDQQLRQLKRATISNPNDVEVLHRYIAALERVAGGIESADSIRLTAKVHHRTGWVCPDPEVDESNSIAVSPDGVCVYFSDLRHDGRRTVSLIINGEEVDWLLPESYNPERESDDSCIFCGDPQERK